jgi:hypothetical protein
MKLNHVRIGKYLFDTCPTQDGPKREVAASSVIFSFAVEYTKSKKTERELEWNGMQQLVFCADDANLLGENMKP